MNFGPCQIIVEDGSGDISGLQYEIAQDCSTVRLYSQYIQDADDLVFTLQVEVLDAADDNTLLSTTAFAEADTTSGTPYDYYDLTLGVTDGLVQLKLTVTYIDGSGTVVIQSGCLFVDCATRCLLPLADLKTQMLHYALTRTTGCNCRECLDLANAYKAYKTLLNSQEISTSDDCGCGSITSVTVEQ